MDTSKQMPDLMGAAHAAPGNAAGHRRILAHLEHGPRAPARPARAWEVDGWTLSLLLLLLTMCGVAWMMHEETITPVTFKSQRERPRSVAARPAAAPAPAVEVAAHGVGQAAAIINTAPPAAAPAPAAAAVRPDRAASHQAAAAPRARAAPVRAADGPAPAGDTDVTLLTALVAHAGKPASVAPERTRDVVERRDGDRTADLLVRCKQLGLMEGMLCRSRICAGSWESDPACRAPAN